MVGDWKVDWCDRELTPRWMTNHNFAKGKYYILSSLRVEGIYLYTNFPAPSPPHLQKLENYTRDRILFVEFSKFSKTSPFQIAFLNNVDIKKEIIFKANYLLLFWHVCHTLINVFIQVQVFFLVSQRFNFKEGYVPTLVNFIKQIYYQRIFPIIYIP